MTLDVPQGREEALRLDRADPTGRFRDQFHLPAAPGGGDGVYLCAHSLGLQPRSAAARVEQELQRWARRGIGAYFEEPAPWYPYHETIRPALARLVGAAPEEVVAMNALTVNLHLMLATFYRPTATRRRILIEAGAFPSDRYAVMSQIELHRLDPDDALVTVAPRDGERTLRTDDIESLLDRQGDEIALVLLPGVQFQTGQRLDLQRIAATARRCGCRVGFDLAHAVGNVPLALHDWDIDFAVWCSYKYLNAGRPAGSSTRRAPSQDGRPRWSTLRRALMLPRLLRVEPDTCRDLLLFAVQCQEGHGPAVRTEDQRTGQVPQVGALEVTERGEPLKLVGEWPIGMNPVHR